MINYYNENNPDRFTNQMLDAIQKSKIIHNFNEGMSPKEVARGMNISEDYVEQIIGEYERKYHQSVE